MKQSKFFSLKTWDFLKSAVLAGLVVIIPSLLQILENQQFPTGDELLHFLKWGGTAALAYLVKNLFTNSDGQLVKKEQDSGSK